MAYWYVNPVTNIKNKTGGAICLLQNQDQDSRRLHWVQEHWHCWDKSPHLMAHQSMTLKSMFHKRAERQSAQMSKIANDSLTPSGTRCFTAVRIWQTVGVKGLNCGQTLNAWTNKWTMLFDDWWLQLPAKPVVIMLVVQLATQELHSIPCWPVATVVGPRGITQRLVPRTRGNHHGKNTASTCWLTLTHTEMTSL